MKLLTSPILKHPNHFLHSGEWWICYSDFTKFFDLPKEAEKIRLEFHDRSSKDRYLVEVRACNCGEDGCVTAWVNGEATSMASSVVAYIYKRLGRTKAYVECTYEVSQ